MWLLNGAVSWKLIFQQIQFLVLSLLIFHLPASADVTITEHLVARGTGPNYEWNRIIKIKGSKMRIESQHEKETFVTVYDLESGQEMILQPKHRVASIFGLVEESAKLKHTLKLVKSSIQPTGKTKQALGMNCEEYKYDVYIPDAQHLYDGHLIATVQHDTGTLCIARDVIGSKDFGDFAHQLKDHDYIPGSISDQNRVQTDTALFLLIARLDGLVLEHTANNEIGGGSGVGLYGTVMSGQRFSTVTSVTAEPLSDDEFRVPDGWKIRKDRSIGLSVPVHLRSERNQPLLIGADSSSTLLFN
jgi:hypothetical protein